MLISLVLKNRLYKFNILLLTYNILNIAHEQAHDRRQSPHPITDLHKNKIRQPAQHKKPQFMGQRSRRSVTNLKNAKSIGSVIKCESHINIEIFCKLQQTSG